MKELGYRVEASRFYYDYADGLAIVIDSATGTYYGMNSLGSAVFDKLAKGEAPSAVFERLLELDGCPEQMERIFAAFFSRLQRVGLLVLGQTEGSAATPFERKVDTGDFSLEVKEFADIQEILLADPIHDVDSDIGWPHLK